MKLKILFLAFALLASLKAQAQSSFSFRTNVFNQDTSIIRASQLQNQSLFYDQEQNNYILIRNINFPSNLRVAFMNPDFKVKKVVRPPETVFKRAFSIQGLSFYPTELGLTGKRNGQLIFETDKGFIVIDLVKMDGNFVEFGSDFTEGKHEEVKFLELKSAVYN